MVEHECDCIHCVKAQLEVSKARLVAEHQIKLAEHWRDCYQTLVKMSRFQIEVTWAWSTFKETSRAIVDSLDDIEKEVEKIILKIVDRYAFDCGDLSRPLNPRVLGLTVTPLGKSEYQDISNSSLPMVMAGIEQKRMTIHMAKENKQ